MSRTQLLRRLLPGVPGTPGLWQSCPAVPNGLQHCSFSSSREEEQKQQSSMQPASSSLVQLANIVNRPMPASLSGAAGFAASPLMAMPARRGTGVMGARRPALPMLPGMGPATTPSAALARSYYTEGEIFGTTFMYTTNMMFWAGIVGAVAFRRNLIILLLSAETVMLACNMNFLFTAAYLNDITGAIMSITITTIAACETAIGLALCVAYFHMRSATDVEALNLLK
ncbi:hypothetical protein HXX76_010811 [Chlamydomonas incerta]|uniref:NADH dehydrogenase subunit 4L n=1 Tax=Chlamydomonas incerta TaxID=51695 RepID=A0A835T104_CHLIN|nr:hypothetical protein HXX76_010811 [Chlamydomonas incerta]|eukprot:KAG2429576.1 hypothetical protein HXX76_010811 [Chlamydomonas incerta]